ncbi:MAG: HAD-IB family phosphatase [Methylococcaceae bacterium]|jgi:phosphoserine phosphatase
MSFDIVCFDCDSTLTKIEGIDELAIYYELDDGQVTRLTKAAMEGEVALESIYERRLAMINPDRASINWLAKRYLEEMVDGAQEVCQHLLAAGKDVHIVSSGLRQAILPLAEALGVAELHVHAVDIYFRDDGSYITYDRRSRLTRSLGKAEICRRLFKPPKTLVMVGDSHTDVEAKQPGVSVLGFGGVVARDLVREQADFFCETASLLPILTHIL